MTEAERYCEYVTKNCRLGDFNQRAPLNLIGHDLIGKFRGFGEGDFRRALRIEGFRQT